MLESINNFIQTVLNPISVVVGIIAFAVPIFWTWYEVIFGRKKRQRIFLKDIKSSQGERASILVVDFKPDADILNQVLQARQQDELLKNVPDERIFHLRNDTWLNPDDMVGLVEKLRVQLGKVAKAGTDVLYFIYAGPVMPAAVIGAELANSCRVILFQHQQGKYINWGKLKHV
jgi:hypothetical protein